MWWSRHLSLVGEDFVYVAAIFQWWRRLAIAISDDRVGTTVLESLCRSSSLLVSSWMIFSCLGAALSASVEPSGQVPDVNVNRCGYNWRRNFGGDVFRLDRDFADVSRVLCVSVIIMDPIVTYVFFEVL
jgi:hypothetical protein